MEGMPFRPVTWDMDGIDPVSKGHRVLVVDDEPEVVWVLELALGSEGYDVCTARNGVEAMAQIGWTGGP